MDRGILRSAIAVLWKDRGLFAMLDEMFAETGSARGKEILSDWDNSLKSFKKIIPNDYAKMLKLIAEEESNGVEHDDAVLNAFKKFTA